MTLNTMKILQEVDFLVKTAESPYEVRVGLTENTIVDPNNLSFLILTCSSVRVTVGFDKKDEDIKADMGLLCSSIMSILENRLGC